MLVFPPARLRRSIILLMVLVCTGLGLFLVIVPAPDLSIEEELARRMADLRLRVKHAESLNGQRKEQLSSLFDQFSRVVTALRSSAPSGHINATEARLAELLSSGAVGLEGSALAKGVNLSYDLSLPSLGHFLPHTVGKPGAFVPAFKLAVRPRSHVSMVLGVPTVKREHQSYLHVTLKSIVDNLSPEEALDCLVIVFVADTDPEFVTAITSDVKREFGAQIDSGLIEVISPPSDFYPDMSSLRKTLGDDSERVQWRSKQNLDYAFLMMYAQWRGNFYVQLEDDVLTKPGFVTTMKEFALGKLARKEPWFVIDYCQLGFIGKLFRSSDLPVLVSFFVMFYNDKPVDWLLEHVLSTMVCKLDQDAKKCKKEKDVLWVHFKPSLFQHIGTHSSLKGKVQKLKDKQFGSVPLYSPHTDNPPARIETVIKHYKSYSLTRAYSGETFYWGLVPQAGDTVTFWLTPPVPLKGIRMVSGNAEHPSDRFLNTTLELKSSEGNNVPARLPRTKDDFVVLGGFDTNGMAASDVDPAWGAVAAVRLSVHAASENWVILSEMHFKT